MEANNEVARIKRRLRYIRLQREEACWSSKTTGGTEKGQGSTSRQDTIGRTYLSPPVGHLFWQPESEPVPSSSRPFLPHPTAVVDSSTVNRNGSSDDDDNDNGLHHLMMLELKVKGMRASHSQASTLRSPLSPQSVSLLPAATTSNVTSPSAIASTADHSCLLVPKTKTERHREIRQRVRERLAQTSRGDPTVEPLNDTIQHDTLHRIEQPYDEAMASTRMLIRNARCVRPMWRTQLKRDLHQRQGPPLLPVLSPRLGRSSEGVMEGGSSDASPRTTALTEFPSSSTRSQFPKLLPRSAGHHPQDHSRSFPHRNQTKTYTVPTSPLPMMSSIPVRIQEQASVTATTRLRESPPTPSLLSLSKTHTHSSRGMAVSPRLSWETQYTSSRAPEHFFSSTCEVPVLPTNTRDNNMDNDGPSSAMMARKRLVLHAIRNLGRDGHGKSLATLLLRPTTNLKRTLPRSRSIVTPSSPPLGPVVVIAKKNGDVELTEGARNLIEEARAFLSVRTKGPESCIPQVRDVTTAASRTPSDEKSVHNESKETSSPFVWTQSIDGSKTNSKMLLCSTADFPYILPPSDLSSSSSSRFSSSSSSSSCDTTDSAVVVVNMQKNHKATSGRRKITQGLTMGKSLSEGKCVTRSPHSARRVSKSRISSDKQVRKRSNDNDITGTVSSATSKRKSSVLKKIPQYASGEHHGRSDERESSAIKLILCRSHRESNTDDSNASVAVRTRHSQEASAALTQNTDPVTEPSSGSSSSQGSTAMGRKDSTSANHKNKPAKWYVRPSGEDEHVNRKALDAQPRDPRQHKRFGKSMNGTNQSTKTAVRPVVMQMVFFDSIVQEAPPPKLPTRNLAAVPEEDDDWDETAEF